jgi:Pretoxin HINT domain
MFSLALLSCWLLVVVPGDSPTAEELRAYEAAAAKAGKDVLAHIRLASWCELHGMQVERHKHLGIALELEPENPAVHGLLGQVSDGGEWRMPQAVVEDYLTDAKAKASLASYRARREKIPDTAQAHWQLAEWCEENGLPAEARAHLAAVVRLNPAREEAWKKLGYQRPKGRWTTAELATAVKAETDHQRKADAHWRPLLEKWNGGLARKSKRADSEAALGKVRDPRAVPSIWRVFILGGPADQERALRLLSQIDSPAASRALASLAVMGATERIRGRSADALLKRDPREFVATLIGVFRDPIEYEVREVLGPGKPGELYVHGERANRRFFYEAPPPLARLRPTDMVGFDAYGLPVANRVVGFTLEPASAAINPLLMGSPDLSNAPQVLGRALGAQGVALGQKMVQNQQNAVNAGNLMGGFGFGQGYMVPLTVPIPVGQLMMQAQQKAAVSREQLLADVAALDRYNEDVNGKNDRATEALRAALLETHGPKRKDWIKWWTDLNETSTNPFPRPREPDKKDDPAPKTLNNRPMFPGFRAGTLVWTLTGLQPVETLRTGDQVLANNSETGGWSYKPVLAVRHGVRQPIKKLTIGGRSIETTAMERLWVAGKGWAMVGDLKPGESLRSVSGIGRLTKVEDSGFEPVYHVRLGEGPGIAVGEFGILAHDEQMARPLVAPFDSAAIMEGAPASR